MEEEEEIKFPRYDVTVYSLVQHNVIVCAYADIESIDVYTIGGML